MERTGSNLSSKPRVAFFDDDLRDRESAKVQFGKTHFEAVAVGEDPAEFIMVRKIDDLMA